MGETPLPKRLLLTVTMMAALAAPAWAGGTSVGGTLVNLPPVCHEGYRCQGGSCEESDAECTTNADCNLCDAGSDTLCTTNTDCLAGTLSPRSKLKLTGAGQLTGTIKDARDRSGAAITTDGIAGTADDYILGVQLYSETRSALAIVKVDFKNGKARLSADLRQVVAGQQSVVVPLVALLAPPKVPSDCPGGNSAAEIEARSTENDCTDGLVIAFVGVVPGL